ncbi:hypothetical protein NKH18_34475 [Streptomyces sp. M10(2022)]
MLIEDLAPGWRPNTPPRTARRHPLLTPHPPALAHSGMDPAYRWSRPLRRARMAALSPDTSRRAPCPPPISTDPSPSTGAKDRTVRSSCAHARTTSRSSPTGAS